MKKVIALMSIVGLLTFTNFNGLNAQEEQNAEATAPVSEQVEAEAEAAEDEVVAATTDEEPTKSFHQV